MRCSVGHTWKVARAAGRRGGGAMPAVAAAMAAEDIIAKAA